MSRKTIWPQELTEVSTTALNQVGEIVDSPDGTKSYMYVQANGVIAVKDAVKLDSAVNDGVSVLVSTNDDEAILGVALVAMVLDDFAWILVRGVVLCKVIAATATGSILAAGNTDGTLKLAAAADVPASKNIVALETGVAAGSLVRLA